MGERPSGDGVPGRRHAQPGGAVSGPWEVRDAAALETALAAALRRGDLDPGAELQAVAAFRAARATGAHRVRTRRRDDWRPAAERRARRTVKTTLGVVFASLTLGGVAVAAIGSAGSSADGAGRGTIRPPAATADRPGGAASPASSTGPRPGDRPAPAQDTEAHCRAYEQVRSRGKALESRTWERLVAAAGGRAKVAEYCAEQLTSPSAVPSRSGGTGKSGEGAAGGGTGAVGRTGTSGNGGSGGGTSGSGTSGSGTSGSGTSGNNSGGTGKTAGNGQAGGQGGGKHT